MVYYKCTELLHLTMKRSALRYEHSIIGTLIITISNQTWDASMIQGIGKVTPYSRTLSTIMLSVKSMSLDGLGNAVRP